MLTWTTLYLISNWVIRMAMLVYVPQRRTPAAARAWLLLIFFLPWAGLALYALVGRIYVSRRRIEQQQRASQMIQTVQRQMQTPEPHLYAALPENLRSAVGLAASLGDFVAVGGNCCELLPGYEVPLARLLDDIDQALDSVHMMSYIFEDDATGRRVADALIGAARRGVRCRVLMDAVGSRQALKHLASGLRQAGVEALATLPVGLFRRNVARFDLRNHRKIVVIDGGVAYTGSQNMVEPEFVSGCPNEELVVRITGPVVDQFQAVFLGDWYFETGKVLDAPGLFPEHPPTGATSAQVLPSGPGYGRQNTKELMVALIYAARRRIVLATPYFVPDEPFLQALQTAVRRDVAVHLVLPSRSNQRVTHLAQQSYYEGMLEAGVQIHLYGARFLHMKYMSVDDDLALIGSTNIDIRSFALNAEVSLLIYDPEVVARLRAMQERYFAESCLLEIEEWQRRPVAAKIVQNTARLADSLL